MRVLKILGFAPLAATVLMAVVGASTASAADRLCETNTNPCNAPVAVGGIIRAEATDPILTGGLVITEALVTCGSSTATVKLTGNSGATNPTGEVTALTWTGCKEVVFGGGCAVTTVNLPYRAEVVTPSPNLTVTAHSGGGSPGAKVVCGGSISCTFQRADLTLPIDVGSPASLTTNEIELEKVAGGGLCPSGPVYWDAKYVAESPTSSLFVSSS